MNNHIKRRGMLIILSSPSGAGKTTVATALLNADINLHKSVSATTRLPRPQEEQGKDYVFISKDEFLHHVENDNFAEHANVFGNHYGTFKSTVDEALENGRDVLFVIDWQGTQQLAQAYAHDMVRVFMLPPTFEDLKLRLENRKSDSPDVINQRLLKASDEMSHWAEYDYVVINKDLDQTIDAIHDIIKSERLRRLRQIDLVDFINTLRKAGEAYGEN
ncbi:MAG: guanylate kinase [Alphaproteobacteria bacterium]|nr:guanylate kinase [Alphaproteobacteria bacterium]